MHAGIVFHRDANVRNVAGEVPIPILARHLGEAAKEIRAKDAKARRAAHVPRIAAAWHCAAYSGSQPTLELSGKGTRVASQQVERRVGT